MDSGLSLFTRFGGIRSMARELGVPPSNVQGWKDRRAIPAKRQQLVLQRAKDLQLDVTAEDVMFPFPEDRAVQ